MDLIDKFETREGDSALRIYDIIERKTQHGELTREELAFFVKELCEGRLPDYQASALIMAIFLNGMTERETADLTAVMADSGDQIDLSGIQGIKVDKHSTGGIGDKTTLVIGPIIVACGGRMAKMSGRGLGYAGGTIDKLESIPGFRVALSQEEFIRNVNTVGMAITGQTANVAPADKKIYALRDVTATVASIPLIASSVMSKKLASGADKLVLDVKMAAAPSSRTWTAPGSWRRPWSPSAGGTAGRRWPSSPTWTAPWDGTWATCWRSRRRQPPCGDRDRKI